MKGDAKVIDYLNKGLRSELTAINQYWLHYRLLEDWGFNELAKKWREESIEEMHHADKFIDGISPGCEVRIAELGNLAGIVGAALVADAAGTGDGS